VKLKPGPSDLAWMAAGAAVLVAIAWVVLRFREVENPAAALALKAQRVDLVESMRSALVSGAEAEKSAVLALTDDDAQRSAAQARSAAADVERDAHELEGLLDQGGTAAERSRSAEFTREFTALEKIDRDLLALAIKNTNLEAARLAFGPAADAIGELDAALSRVAAKLAASADAVPALERTHGAQCAALRIQALLAPHIAEESDAKMDAMEARMAKDDAQVRKDLDALAGRESLRGDPDLAQASASYAHFSELRAKILALSRENTHVKSLELSLNEKRKAMFQCLDALDALQRAILEEPIAGIDYGRPSHPRRLESAPRGAR
jgi:hypothetical protein